MAIGPQPGGGPAGSADYSNYGYGAQQNHAHQSQPNLTHEQQQAQWHQQWQQYYASMGAQPGASQQSQPPQQPQPQHAGYPQQPPVAAAQPSYYQQQHQPYQQTHPNQPQAPTPQAPYGQQAGYAGPYQQQPYPGAQQQPIQQTQPMPYSVPQHQQTGFYGPQQPVNFGGSSASPGPAAKRPRIDARPPAAAGFQTSAAQMPTYPSQQQQWNNGSSAVRPGPLAPHGWSGQVSANPTGHLGASNVQPRGGASIRGGGRGAVVANSTNNASSSRGPFGSSVRGGRAGPAATPMRPPSHLAHTGRGPQQLPPKMPSAPSGPSATNGRSNHPGRVNPAGGPVGPKGLPAAASAGRPGSNFSAQNMIPTGGKNRFEAKVPTGPSTARGGASSQKGKHHDGGSAKPVSSNEQGAGSTSKRPFTDFRIRAIEIPDIDWSWDIKEDLEREKVARLAAAQSAKESSEKKVNTEEGGEPDHEDVDEESVVGDADESASKADEEPDSTLPVLPKGPSAQRRSRKRNRKGGNRGQDHQQQNDSLAASVKKESCRLRIMFAPVELAPPPDAPTGPSAQRKAKQAGSSDVQSQANEERGTQIGEDQAEGQGGEVKTESPARIVAADPDVKAEIGTAVSSPKLEQDVKQEDSTLSTADVTTALPEPEPVLQVKVEEPDELGVVAAAESSVPVEPVVRREGLSDQTEAKIEAQSQGVDLASTGRGASADPTAAETESLKTSDDWSGYSKSPPQPSSNRVNIAYAATKKRIMIDADVISAVRIFREEGKVELDVALVLSKHAEKKTLTTTAQHWQAASGVMVESRSRDSDHFNAVAVPELEYAWEHQTNVEAKPELSKQEKKAKAKQAKAQAEGEADTSVGDGEAEENAADSELAPSGPYETLPPLFRLLSQGEAADAEKEGSQRTMTITIWLDKLSTVPEAKWLKTGDVDEWLSSHPGFASALSSQQAWYGKLSVVDPDPPPTIQDVFTEWASKSFVGLPRDRRRFVQAHFQDASGQVEILCRLVRGERAGGVSLRELGNPLAEASRRTAFASHQTHLSLAVLAMFGLAEGLAQQVGWEDALFNAKVGEILMGLPQNLIFKACDGLFKEVLEKGPRALTSSGPATSNANTKRRGSAVSTADERRRGSTVSRAASVASNGGKKRKRSLSRSKSPAAAPVDNSRGEKKEGDNDEDDEEEDDEVMPEDQEDGDDRQLEEDAESEGADAEADADVGSEEPAAIVADDLMIAAASAAASASGPTSSTMSPSVEQQQQEDASDAGNPQEQGEGQVEASVQET